VFASPGRQQVQKEKGRKKVRWGLPLFHSIPAVRFRSTFF
jgi:hypothetical protein